MRAVTLFFFFLFVATVAGGSRENVVGSYSGESVGGGATGRSYVLRLDVMEADGVYSLAAEMNDTNREEGMDHTSNTHWRWSGRGHLQSGVLVFTFSSPDAAPEKGSMRLKGKEVSLHLGNIRYRLKRISGDR